MIACIFQSGRKLWQAIKGKFALTVASFLYEIVCRHECIIDMAIKMY